MERTTTDLSETKNNELSLESPFTSIGSAGTSYNAMLSTYGINLMNGMNFTSEKNNIYSGCARSRVGGAKGSSYLTLRAKAEEGGVKHKGRTKAVMDALQKLQTKIGKIEADRSNAELNLKCLTFETKGYKELFKQKQELDKNVDGILLKDCQSKELEAQLGHAQGRCKVLERQLESMRKVMNSRSLPKTIASVAESRTCAKEVENPCTHNSTPQSINKSPAIEKLNNLEKEHERLMAMQSETENKIKKLDEKIQKEIHHRELLEDKTKELQTISCTKEKIDDATTSRQRPLKRKKRRNGSKSTTSEGQMSLSHSSDRPQTSRRYSSPTHYLVDFSNIPFVVGQSTSRSHSVGANVQNVLSIMKSHNMICCDEVSSKSSSASSHATKQSPLLSSCEHLQDLLVTLRDEFAQLMVEQRETMSELLQSTSKTRSTIVNLEKKKEKFMECIGLKGKQMQIICDHLEKVKLAEKVDVVATDRRSPEVKMNPNLDMYKNVKKLQSTLCKNDI